MRTLLVLPLALASMAAAPAPVAAPVSDIVRADMQCFILTSQLQGNSNTELANAGQMMSVYYLGKVDGRGLDMEKLLFQAKSLMAGVDNGKRLQACGDEFSKRGDALMAAGKRLEAAGL